MSRVNGLSYLIAAIRSRFPRPHGTFMCILS